MHKLQFSFIHLFYYQTLRKIPRLCLSLFLTISTVPCVESARCADIYGDVLPFLRVEDLSRRGRTCAVTSLACTLNLRKCRHTSVHAAKPCKYRSKFIAPVELYVFISGALYQSVSQGYAKRGLHWRSLQIPHFTDFEFVYCRTV